MVLFGGENDSLWGDTWTFNGTTWTELLPATSPPARVGASMAYDPATGNAVLFGGYGSGGLLADTWTYSPATPGAPTITAATPGNGQVRLSWNAPASEGASSITGYDVYEGTSPDGESATPVNTSLITGTSTTITELSNGTDYYFTVGAVNTAGNSPASNEVSSTPFTFPGAPTITAATSGNGQVRLSWNAPASDGGSTITGYDAYEKTRIVCAATSTHDCIVRGLTNGTSYRFTVEAVNARGNSPASSPSAAVVPHLAGSQTLASFAEGSALLSPSLRAQVVALARTIKDDGDKVVLITGHTDSTPSVTKALALSLMRAKTVEVLLRQQLTALRVTGVTFKVTGKGSADPVASDRSAAGRAKNRRVDASFS
jgi:outer membrane protein OmpA-like peptidoglycan-associated protein